MTRYRSRVGTRREDQEIKRVPREAKHVRSGPSLPRLAGCIGQTYVLLSKVLRGALALQCRAARHARIDPRR